MDLSIPVGPGQDAALGGLRLHVAAQVVERQELGVDPAGVGEDGIWKWRQHARVFAFLSQRVFPGSRHEVSRRKRHPPVSWRNLMSWHCREFALTQLFAVEEQALPLLTSSNIPAAGVSASPGRGWRFRSAQPVSYLELFIFRFYVEKQSH